MKSISNGVCMILVSLLLVQCTFSQNAKEDRDDFIAGKDNNSKKENQEERIEFISMNGSK